MAGLLEMRRTLVGMLSRIEVLGPLVARLSVGVMFAQSGWGKLHGLDQVTEFFTSLGIPWPAEQALLVASVEFGCGILLAAGLFTRLACVPLIITMTVAIGTALWEQVGSVADLLALSEFTYIAVMLWVVLVGPGAASVDALLIRLVAGSSDTAPAGARVAA